MASTPVGSVLASLAAIAVTLPIPDGAPGRRLRRAKLAASSGGAWGQPWACWTMCRWSSCRSPSPRRAAVGCSRSTAPTWPRSSRAPTRTSPACSARRGPRASSRGRTWTSSPYLAEMSANKRSVGLELKHPAAREAALRAAGHRRRVRHQLLHAGGARPRPRLRRRGRGEPADRLRRPAGLRLRPDAAVLRVPRVGPEPGAARRPRRDDRLPRPGAGRHRHDLPARLLRRPARADRACSPRSSTATAPARAASSTSPSSRRRCPASGRSSSTTRSRARRHALGQPAGVAGAAGRVPVRRRRRVGGAHGGRRPPVAGARRAARRRGARRAVRHARRPAGQPRRARRADRTRGR